MSPDNYFSRACKKSAQKCREAKIIKVMIQSAIFIGISFILLSVQLAISVLLLLVIINIYVLTHRDKYGKKYIAAVMLLNLFVGSQIPIAMIQAHMVNQGTFVDASVYAGRGTQLPDSYYHNWVKFEYLGRVNVASDGTATYNTLTIQQIESKRMVSSKSEISYPQVDGFTGSTLKTLSAGTGPTTLKINITISLSTGPTRFNCPIPAGAYAKQYVNPVSLFYPVFGALLQSVKPTAATLNNGHSNVWETNIKAGDDIAIDIETIGYGFDPAIDGRGIGSMDFDFDQVVALVQVSINGTIISAISGHGEQTHPDWNFWGWIIPDELLTIIIIYFMLLACSLIVTFLTRKVNYAKLMSYMIMIFTGIGFFWWVLEAPERIPPFLGWIQSVPLLGDIVVILSYIVSGIQYVLTVGFMTVVVYFVSRIFTEIAGTFLGLN